MIAPIAAAPIAEISTAAAATSFALPDSGCCSSEILSVRNSIALLNASLKITMVIAKITQHHSTGDILNEKPSVMTTSAASP